MASERIVIFHRDERGCARSWTDKGELVRCGKCKRHLPETERTNPYCTKYGRMTPDDWYCADGEREVQE